MAYGYGYGFPLGGKLKKALAPPTEDLYLRLFADSANFALSSGKITTWQGSGSSGLSAVQGNAAYQPVPGSGINGKTTVVFSSGSMAVPGVALGVFDIYVVLKTSTTNRMLLEHSDNAFSHPGFWLYAGTPSSRIQRGVLASTWSPNSTPWVSDGNATLVRMGHSGTHSSHVFQRDGVTIPSTDYDTDTIGTSVVTDTLFIGARNPAILPLDGEVGEILIYNKEPNALRAATIVAYSQWFWGTP